MQANLSGKQAAQVALDMLLELDTGDAKANAYLASAVVRLRMILRGGKRKLVVGD